MLLFLPAASLLSLLLRTLGSSLGSSRIFGDLLHALGGVDGRELLFFVLDVARRVISVSDPRSDPRSDTLELDRLLPTSRSTEELREELREEFREDENVCFGPVVFNVFVVVVVVVGFVLASLAFF